MAGVDGGDDDGGRGGPPAGPVTLPLDGTLDLHTFDPGDLGELLPAWIDASHAAGLRALRVVHGKGTGALRRSVEALLRRHPLVASFSPGDEAAGGWGATLVTLLERPISPVARQG
jgi:DNA-nicking Smr family endonuclease